MLNQINTLLVINEFDLAPLDILFFVFFLLHCEHVLIKLLLQLFIGVVYAKLLETVFFKDFKAKDIK